jgi:hypothetical protein
VGPDLVRHRGGGRSARLHQYRGWRGGRGGHFEGAVFIAITIFVVVIVAGLSLGAIVL